MPVEQEPIDYDPNEPIPFLLLLLLYVTEPLLPPFRNLTVNEYVFLLVEVVMGVMLGWDFARLLDLELQTSVDSDAAEHIDANLSQGLDHPFPVYSALRVIPVLHIIHWMDRDTLLGL